MAEDERLMKLQHFFEVDLAIKKEMHSFRFFWIGITNYEQNNYDGE